FAANNDAQVKVSDNRSILVASQDFVRRNPRTVAAVMRVLLRGIRQCADASKTDDNVRIFSEFQRQEAAVNRAIWRDYVFDPAFHDAFGQDMEAPAAFLEATGRIRRRINVLDYSYTEPLKQIDASLVRVEGRWRP